MKINKAGFIGIVLMAGILSGCINNGNHSGGKQNLIIFHAGSLTKPFQEIAKSFEAENPNVQILSEAAGSRECARKISELGKPCDIIATSDYAVIETLLIPGYADWLIAFAGNEMCLAYSNSSRMSKEINPDNWAEILLNDSVYFGRSDPEADPCGYRTVILFDLAEKYYKIEGLANHLDQKDKNFIRPKEMDMLALLETHTIDYMFIYASVAKQHQLPFIKLPDEINLSNPKFAAYYSTASVELSGKNRNEKIVQKGEPMVYGISILNNAPNRAMAEKFLEFLLTPDKGMKILEQNGQKTMMDTNSKYLDKIPFEIKKIMLP
jgi:molybdate/tungstate transport system substrate-binding protein